MKTVIRVCLHFLFVVFLATMFAFKPAEKLNWLLDFDQATELSKKDSRPILMVFSGSDWCKPCMVLKKDVLESKKFEKYASESHILVKLDFPRLKKNKLPADLEMHNERIAEKYNPEGIFPMVILLDENQNILGSSTKSRISPDDFIAMLDKWSSVD